LLSGVNVDLQCAHVRSSDDPEAPGFGGDAFFLSADGRRSLPLPLSRKGIFPSAEPLRLVSKLLVLSQLDPLPTITFPESLPQLFDFLVSM
jgi:hypothetical protein